MLALIRQSLEERQSSFDWIIVSVLPYGDSGNTYYYLPCVKGTCFSFEYTNLGNVLNGINILKTAVYCYLVQVSKPSPIKLEHLDAALSL
jgi:hypothetical protein